MITAPIPNLNGSSKDDLIEGWHAAWLALHESLQMLANCSPHPRDFQISPAGDYELAREEHRARYAAVQAVMADLRVLAESVDR